MNRISKIALIRSFLGDSEAEVDDCLTAAESAIMNRLYPFEDAPDALEIPERYAVLSCRLAERIYLRKGAEGEIGHNEPDVSRTYGSANDEDLLSEVTPFARFL